MPDQFGDLPVPGTSGVSEVRPSDILASYARFTQKGCTVAKIGVGAKILGGTVMGRVTATKKYVPYSDAAGDGSQVALGVLRQSVDTTDGDKLGNLVVSGIIKDSKLVGRDAAADTDLNARRDTINDLYIF